MKWKTTFGMTKNYTNTEKIAMICSKHEEASKQYLQDKDFPKYQLAEKKIMDKLKANNISMADYWAYVMRK